MSLRAPPVPHPWLSLGCTSFPWLQLFRYPHSVSRSASAIYVRNHFRHWKHSPLPPNDVRSHTAVSCLRKRLLGRFLQPLIITPCSNSLRAPPITVRRGRGRAEGIGGGQSRYSHRYRCRAQSGSEYVFCYAPPSPLISCSSSLRFRHYLLPTVIVAAR